VLRKTVNTLDSHHVLNVMLVLASHAFPLSALRGVNICLSLKYLVPFYAKISQIFIDVVSHSDKSIWKLKVKNR
jgi:hypothetical protein